MVGADGFLQLGHRLTALPGIHRRQPFRFRAERRIGELFLLRFKLGTRRRDAIPSLNTLRYFCSALTLALLAGWSLIWSYHISDAWLRPLVDLAISCSTAKPSSRRPLWNRSWASVVCSCVFPGLLLIFSAG
jgi:hypothetical protein